MSENTLDNRGDWDDEDEPLPESVRMFTAPEFDTDEATARRAADGIRYMTSSLLDSLCELEDVERALRESEPASRRARRARVAVRRAIAGFNEVIGGVAAAQDMFALGWSSRRLRGDDPGDLSSQPVGC